MSEMRRLARRITRLRPHEIWVRSSQAAHTALERRGLTRDAHLASDAEFLGMLAAADVQDAGDLLRYFRSQAHPPFFPAFHDRQDTVALLRDEWPAVETRCIADADRAGQGRFDLLGFSDLDFGSPINWHLDPTTGTVAPLRHWSRIDCLDPVVVGNFKVVAELNRHQHFITLGKAYWYTGDDRYAAMFCQQIAAWMDAFPPKLGFIWESSLDQAFRLISWIWALHFFRDSPLLSAELFLRVLKHIDLQARHIETHLSTYSSPNTHLTGEALGLFYAGVTLPALPRSSRWRRTGSRILEQQLSKQVLADGVYFERSTYYHRYTTDFYLHYMALGELLGLSVADDVATHVRRLCDHLMFIARPDGTTPMIGDDDGGHTLPLAAQARNDFRGTLAVAASLFSNAQYRFAAGPPSEALVWMLGRRGLERFRELEPRAPTETSRAFPVGGYYVMRDSWGPDGNYMLIDCGPHGVLNCGHAHADALSVDVAAGGRTALVDPGTFSYTSSRDERQWFRSSAAHNTLTLDGVSSSVPAGPFSWDTVARATPESWITHPGFDFFSGKHDGYARLADPATHRREVLFVRSACWIIRDSIESAGPHTAELTFQFAPGQRVRVDGCDIIASDAHGQNTILLHVSASEEQLGIDSAPVSECFGTMAHAPRARATSCGTEFISLVIPAVHQRPRVVDIQIAHGRVYRIEWQDSVDTVVLGNGRPWQIGDIVCDFRWAWLRHDQQGGLREYVLLKGSRFAVGGECIITARQPLDFACSEYTGSRHPDPAAPQPPSGM